MVRLTNPSTDEMGPKSQANNNVAVSNGVACYIVKATQRQPYTRGASSTLNVRGHLRSQFGMWRNSGNPESWNA